MEYYPIFYYSLVFSGVLAGIALGNSLDKLKQENKSFYLV
jgi:hypothetical protein